MTTWNHHERQDARSLALHEAAVTQLRAHPELAERALAILKNWETLAHAASRPLRNEWKIIIIARRWDLAVADTERGNELRQASPLVFVLDRSVRVEIRRRFEF